ncbi:MAG: M23 family metallopeptidase [Balneolaceae bacterium]|nr:M23 family metallopeptidase [Balneolaceae bacterium]
MSRHRPYRFTRLPGRTSRSFRFLARVIPGTVLAFCLLLPAQFLLPAGEARAQDVIASGGERADSVAASAAGHEPAHATTESDSLAPSWLRAEYLWPTEASRKLSSTFGETRSAHFHAALDIKTWGQRGFEVYATRSGTLHRIAIGPRGYGKVVYLRHDDGSLSLYAHLMAFAEPIQRLADSLRIADDYAFELDRTLDSLQIRIEQGETVGLSGASGIGPPHLHFELRTPSDRPFNPLLTNLRVEDTIAPAFSGLAVEPLTMASTVEGAHRTVTRRAWRDSGTFRMGTVRASGEIGLAVDVYDQSNDVYNAYAVHQLRMWVDGELRFHAKVDSFAYDQTGQMFIDRVYPLLQSTGRGYQRLWIADGNTLPFYTSRGSAGGRLRLEPGRHEVRIEAEDFYGNRSTAQLSLDIVEEIGIAEAEGASAAKADPAAWRWEADWVAIPREEWRGLTVGLASPGTLPSGTGEVLLDLRGSGASVYMREHMEEGWTLRRVVPSRPALLSAGHPPLRTARWQVETLSPGIDARTAERMGPGETGSRGDMQSVAQSEVRNREQRQIFARFPAGAFHDTLSAGLYLRAGSSEGDTLRLDVLPAGMPVNGSYTLHLPASRVPGDRYALYRLEEGRDRLDYLPGEMQKGYLVSEAEQTGTFLLLEDRTEPRLHSPHLARRPDGQWIVTVQAEDSLSGIDHRRTVMEVNGVRGIAEYEPEDDRLVYYLPRFTPSAEMTVRVEAWDRVGNSATQTFRLGGEAR